MSPVGPRSPATGTSHRRRGNRARLYGLSSEAIAEDQRRRILAAVGEAVSQRGYHATAVLHIIEPAAVSRRTFYDLFVGKDEAFCAAHSEALALVAERMRFAAEREREWPYEVAAAVAAALRWAATEPSRAHLIVSEPFTAGPRPAFCRDRFIARFAPPLRRGRTYSTAELPAVLETGLLGGVVGVVMARLSRGSPASLLDLVPDLIEVILNPYLGGVEARRIAQAWTRSTPGSDSTHPSDSGTLP